MSAPDNEPRRASGLTEAGHARILAGIRRRRAENPSPPKKPYIPLSKEKVDRILGKYRRPLNEIPRNLDNAQIESVEVTEFDEEPKPESDEETRRIHNKIDEEPELELDEETRRLRNKILDFVDVENKKYEAEPNEENQRILAIVKKKMEEFMDFVTREKLN